MKERPILLSAPMVRAILNGSKAQARRIVKPQIGEGYRFDRMSESEAVLKDDQTPGIEFFIFRKNPYGKPGDQLWVRETYLRPGSSCLMEWGEYEWSWTGYGKDSILYCADGETKARWVDPANQRLWYRKMPSIHMPRWASRIQLEIVSARVERLNDISEEDALAEGISSNSKDFGVTTKYGIPDRDGLPGGCDIGWEWKDWKLSPTEAYKSLWESINGKGSWETNPFVWVVEFKEVKK